MKRKFIKLVACLLIIFTLFNFSISPLLKTNYVYADAAEDAANTEAEVENSVGGVLNGIAGILTWIPRAVAVVFGALIQLETYSVLISGSASDSVDSAFISPFDIFFNKFALININIFQTNDVEEGSFVYSLRSNVAAVALVMQIIAVVILAIRCGIGLAKAFLSNVGEQKKEGRDLAEDSLISFAMVLFMDLIMFAIISFNEAFLAAWENIASGLDMSDLMASLRSQALSINYILGTGCCVVYVILSVQTMKFALTYIMRWIMVVVLIIVAPLTPIFYSHSQAKNGSSGVFNRWFRLFASNVFLQTVHGILYLVLVALPLASLITSNSSVSTLDSLGASVVLVICVMYINKVEKMLRYIFGIENDVVSFSMLNNSIHNMVNRVSDVAMAGASMISNTTNNTISTVTGFGQDVSNQASTTNNIIHQFGERAGSLLGLKTGAGALPGAGAAAGAVAGTAGQVVGELADAAENDKKDQNNDAEEVVQDENEENTENQDEQNQPAVALLPGSQADEEQSAEEVEEAARTGLEDAIKQISEESNEESDSEQHSDIKTENNETNENIENIDTQNIHQEDIEAELEGMEDEPEDEEDLADKNDEIISKIEEAKAKVDELEQNLEELKKTTEDNDDELNKLGENIGDDKALEIQEFIDKLANDNGIDYLKDNEQNIIGNNTMTNEEAEYMQKYIRNLSDESEIEATEEELNKNKRIISTGSEKLEDIITNGMASGIVSESTAMALAGNLDNVKNGGTDLSGVILSGSVSTATTNETNSKIETNAEAGTTTVGKGEVQNPNVGVDSSAEIPSNLIDESLQTAYVQSIMQQNAEKIKVVGGEVTNDGKLTGEAVARIMKGMSSGAYSQENYNALREKVKQAGEEHLLQQCESNFTAENAAKLTSDAGKQCVEFMAERSIGTSISVTSQLINMGATMSVASSMQGDLVDNGSSNVLNSLQGRRTAAGG